MPGPIPGPVPDLGRPGVPAYRTWQFRDRASQFATVVPVLNEGDRFRVQLRAMRAVEHGMDLVVVDGGSTDGATDPEALRDAGVAALLVKDGPGRLSAQLRCAFDFCLAAGYSGVVTVDGNGKDGVGALPLFRDRLAQGFDFVQGSRFVRGGGHLNTPKVRLAAIRLVHAPVTSVAAKQRWTDTANGFRAHSAALLKDPQVGVFRDVFDAYELLAYLPIRAARLGLRTGEVPVTRDYPGGTVPTKITSWWGHADLVWVLLRAALGGFDPPDGS